MPRIRPDKPRTYVDWQRRVYERDLFACQVCGKNHHQIPICAHHKKSYHKFPELRLDVNNGITLCEDCHKNQHRKGWKNGS
jgi:5-methylcytosine-specific restriction endonuclease McrA